DVEDYAAGSGLGALWKPTFLRAPSQNGLFSLAPQRHSATAGLPVRSHCLPARSLSAMAPSTSSGPLGRTVIFTGSDMDGLTPRSDRPETGKPQHSSRDRLTSDGRAHFQSCTDRS